MSAVTGELISKYVRLRQSLPAGNSVAALNAEIRALIPKAPVIHELPGKLNRERVTTFEEEHRYLAAASANLRDQRPKNKDKNKTKNKDKNNNKNQNQKKETFPGVGPQGIPPTFPAINEVRKGKFLKSFDTTKRAGCQSSLEMSPFLPH